MSDLTNIGLANVDSDNLAQYEEAIAAASPAPTTLADLQEIVNQVNGTVTPGTIFYFPIIRKSFSNLPDLSVEIVQATSNNVTVKVTNTGVAAATEAFWVEAYFNPRQVPGLNQPWDTIAKQGAVWGVTRSLAPGESLTLTTGGDYYVAGLSSPIPFPVKAQVYVLVDSINHNTAYGNVAESNESNNLAGPVISSAGTGATTANQAAKFPDPGRLPPR